ncbi:Transmembrane protein EpsG [Priestia megaterium Q3]|uniref:Transmembrane protein EpsG n=1 Tax=Priestia megaterium Q3 TaxID=1452722 RepID=A0A806U2B9_PRIMG|nr:EpsG family protein [Priestia megaterium]AKP76103.1 Transmembrane protein EpsG [Priestia megaterium Q3]CAH0206336.1 Transmembrane protein EpsG [Priestia megaterium]
MYVYVALLIATVLIHFVCLIIQNNRRRKISFLIISSIPFIVIMGMRDRFVGTDAIQYYSAFKNIIASDYGWLDYKETRYEVGYYLLNKIVGVFTQDPQIFLFITSIIIVTGIFVFIYQNSKNPFISVLLFQTLYFYCNSFNLLRQYIALAIAINCIFFIKEKKLFKASLVIILASTFHTSALCLFPIAIILCKFKITKANMTKFLCGILFISLSIPFIIQMSVELFPRYQFYLTYDSVYNGGKIMPYVYISMVIVGLIIIRKTRISDWKMNNYYILSIYVFIAGVLGIISSLYFESASRVIPYYSISLLAFIPEFMGLFKNKADRLIILYGLILSTFIYYNILLHSGVAGVYPYTFFGD